MASSVLITSSYLGTPMSSTPLFTPVTLGALALPNRIVMAPLTRCRADVDHVPTPMMATYYAQRASAGLIIAEATMAMAGNSAFNGREPGIHSPAQVAAWRNVTDAVHAKGGRIVLQIWHGGRACHPYFNHGAQPVAPSALAITGDETHTPEGKKPYVIPRVLNDDELPGIIAGFRKAAENAKAAGFDGAEVSSASRTAWHWSNQTAARSIPTTPRVTPTTRRGDRHIPAPLMSAAQEYHASSASNLVPQPIGLSIGTPARARIPISRSPMLPLVLA